jgi:hypothetical protein
MMKNRQRARGRNRLAAARKSRSVPSVRDGGFVAGGWRVRAEARRFQLLEIVRPKAQGSKLQNPPKHHVTEREEHEASSVAIQPA